MKRRYEWVELVASVAATTLLWLPASCGHTSRDGAPAAADEGGASGSTNAPATGGGGPKAPSLVPCTDDAVCSDAGQRCDMQRYVCTECVSVRDCGTNEICSGGACLPFTPCEVTRQCATGVCDTDAGFCVECVLDADCDVNEACDGTTCHARCAGHDDCGDAERSCDLEREHCVECLADDDCGAGAYCAAGNCEVNVCAPGAALCVDATLLTCTDHGAGYEPHVCKVGCAASVTEARCLAEGTGGSENGGSSSAGAGQGANEAGGAGAATADGGGTGTETCPPTPDHVTVPDCGYIGASSRESYRGLVTLRVSGVIYGAPGVPNDPFYVLDSGDLTKAESNCPTCLVFNRASEGKCVCQFECPGKAHALSALLVGGYPEFRSDHDYTVRIDLGPAAAEPLNFALGDCGCDDNSGSFALSFECADQ